MSRPRTVCSLRPASFRATGLAAGLVAIVASAAPAFAGVRTFTACQVNSQTTTDDPAPDTLRDTGGAPVSILSSGGGQYAFSNGSGYTTKTLSDNVFGRASVEEGVLQAAAGLGFGADQTPTPVPVNTRNGSSSSTAWMADSFRTYTGAKPFAWTGSTKVHFAFDLDGSVVIPESLQSAAVSKNRVYAEVVVRILKPGGVDLFHRLQTFDFSAYPDFPTAYQAYGALSNQYDAAETSRTYWDLAGSIADFPLSDDHLFSLDESGKAHLEYEFAPGGDFEWVMSLDIVVQLDGSLQEVSASINLGDTIAASYSGPDGATTYSASGLFPGTAPEAEIPLVCGDANGDGKVTSSDALKALKAAVGGDACVNPVCDVDASGSVTASDALKILKLAVGQDITLGCDSQAVRAVRFPVYSLPEMP